MDTILTTLAHFGRDVLYAVVALATILVVGFPVMDRIMTKGIDLKDALFTKDNQPAGLAFGGMMGLCCFIAWAIVGGEATRPLGVELALTVVELSVTILIFAIVWKVIDVIVAEHNGAGRGINDEVFQQHNWAAACFALAILLGIANGITEVDILGQDPVRDGAVALLVFVCGIGAIALFKYTHLHGRPLLAMYFSEDNPAAGVSLLGYAASANVMLLEVAQRARHEQLSTSDTLAYIAVVASVLIVALAILRRIVVGILGWQLGVHLHHEIFDRSAQTGRYNVGAALMDAFVTLGLTAVLVASLL